MKKLYTLLTVLSIVSICTHAQDEPEYLFDMANVEFSGFGTPFIEFSIVNGKFAVCNGGGGAVLINKKFFFGGYGMGLTTDHSFPDVVKNNNTYTDLEIDFSQGGIWLGYVNRPGRMIHWGVSSKVGVGLLTLTDKDFYIDRQDNLVDDHVFVWTPQAEIEINMAKWFKMNLGVGYRLVTQANKDEKYQNLDGELNPYFKNSMFNSPHATVSFLFGGFGD